MAWRGQGGKRAKGRRGQDPELDNTAWLAELEREAAQAGEDEDEEDWASTLRGRRSNGPQPQSPPAPPAAERGGWDPQDPQDPPPAAERDWAPQTPPPAPPAAEPGWAASPGPPSAPAPEYDVYGADPAGAGSGAWPPDPAPQVPGPAADSASYAPGPAADSASYAPGPAADPDWSWRPPADDLFEAPPSDPAAGGAGRDWDGSHSGGDDQGWRTADVDTPTGTWSPGEPVGREPDYPALFGELYRRGAARQDAAAARQDPVWETPPAAEPLPDQGQPEPPSGSWPFEETTGTWEPSDRSFIWPAEELPSTQAEWDQPAQRSWLDDPGPPAAAPAPPRPDPAGPPAPDQTAAWPAPSPHDWADPEPAPRSSPWASHPGAGNGVPSGSSTGPLGSPPAGPPPADWAAAIPTDVPAASRAADPGAATRAWRPDEAVEVEPGVPLGAGMGAGGTGAFRPATMPDAEPEDDLDEDEAPQGRRKRPAGERQARAWPRIVAVISWIVLVMVVCWFYVFPWLERVLPENF